jgi:hypothetical protein
MSESGVEETQSVLAGIFPELKLTAGAKTTRGGRLGRQSLPVTPEVTFKQEKVAPQINVMQTASPNMTQNVGAPAPTPKPAVNISTEYGQSPTFFGHEDYWKNLEKGVSQKDILEYLDRTPSVLQGANVKGKGGLYDQIISGKVVYPASMGAAPSPTPAPAPTPTPAPAQAPAPAPAPAKNLFEQIQEAGGLAAWAQKSQANGTAAPTAPTVFSRFLSNPRFRMGAVSGRTLTY